MTIAASHPTSLQFFSLLKWIDGRPLLSTIEPYRRKFLSTALDTVQPNGWPLYTMIVDGRAKKNNKTTDLVLGALYCLMFRESAQGSNRFIVANDEDQAGDDLSLAKKLIEVNRILSDELDILTKEIRRKDGRGTMRILPARDVSGAHGKTGVFLGCDEIHGWKNYDILEALAPDPTRADALCWIASYDTVFNVCRRP